MVIEPGQSFFRILGRGTVFHGDEFFRDAHVPLSPILSKGDAPLLVRGPFSLLTRHAMGWR
jgi:hypothetical protein